MQPHAGSAAHLDGVGGALLLGDDKRLCSLTCKPTRTEQCRAHAAPCEGPLNPRNHKAQCTSTVSEVPCCLGMMSVVMENTLFSTFSLPPRMPQLSMLRRVLLAAYLRAATLPLYQSAVVHTV